MKRRRTQDDLTPPVPIHSEPAVCLLCGRTLLPGPTVDQHHLMPRSHGGRLTIPLHKICHQTIHAVFSERELADYYHTIPRLLTHPDIARFVRWVSKRPDGFYDRPRHTQQRRS
ncbi:HNH endonuclease family protein [Chitinimonas naiadis]